jgi:serine/threonine-protein kinase
MLDGRYRLDEELGAGGMSVVWRAFDTVLGRTVAVKLLSADLAADEAASERIRAEAQAIARLAHPNIATVHDFGESVGPDGTRVPYVVLELLDGETLADRLESGPLAWREAVRICAEVASGLAAAHARGIVHQDIKPANVVLTAVGAKIVDFGIAVSANTPDTEGDDPVLGTLRYAAPERLLGTPVGPAADVYALGLVLYRCLTGDLPWQSTSSEQMASNHCYVMPRPLPPIAGLPAGVPDLITRCLAKRPEDRPSSREVARKLAAAAFVHSGIDRWPAVPVPGLRGRPRRARLVAAAVGVVAVGAFAVTCSGRSSDDGWPAFAQAPTGVPGMGQAGYACRVWYSPAGARVKFTVENTGSSTFANWTLAFTAGGAERFTSGSDVVLVQDGAAVTVRASGDLPVGRWTTVELARSGPAGTPPSGFMVNTTVCKAVTGGGQPSPSGVPLERDTAPGGLPPGTAGPETSLLPPDPGSTEGPPPAPSPPPSASPSPPKTGPSTPAPTTSPPPRPTVCQPTARGHAFPPPASCPPMS